MTVDRTVLLDAWTDERATAASAQGVRNAPSCGCHIAEHAQRGMMFSFDVARRPDEEA